MPNTWLATPVAVVALAFFLAFVGVVKSESNKQARAAAAEGALAGAIARDGGSRHAATTRVAALDGAEQRAPEVVAAAAAPVVAPTAGSGRQLALVIGNASYPDDDAALKQPVRDARALADELRLRGFDVELGENLTRQGMQDAFASFAAKITPGAAALVFFSGHGVQSGRQSYLIPVDAQIWREVDVRHDGIAIEPLLADVEGRGAGVKLVIVDASRRNPFERRFRGLSIGLAPITTPEGTLVLYGAAPGQVARDSDSDNSLFVSELLEQIRSHGSTAEDIFNRTRIGVARASNGERVPGVFSSLTENFYFAPSKVAVRESSR
jgi:uncharacterized caspase-like protein